MKVLVSMTGCGIGVRLYSGADLTWCHRMSGFIAVFSVRFDGIYA